MESFEASVSEMDELWNNFIESEADDMIASIQEYKDSLFKVQYESILQAEAKLIKTICEDKITFPRVFAVYYYLLWNGIFSVHNNFKFNLYKNRMKWMRGLSIISGEGVCLDISSHFRDVLKFITDDYHGYTVGMHLEEKDLWNLSCQEIQRKERTFLELSNTHSNLLNHANVLITSPNGMYILDPTNFLIYEVIECSKNNNPLTRIDLRIDLNLNSPYTDVNKFKNTFKKLKDVNQVMSSIEYRKCSVDILSKTLNKGIELCSKHMKDIERYRYVYRFSYEMMSMETSNRSPLFLKIKARKKV